MKTFTHIHDPAQEWHFGPWTLEPDKAVWVDEDTNLDCMIVRNLMGALCGYVGMKPDTRLYGLSYDEVNFLIDSNSLENVHGGLTYGAQCNGLLICHAPDPGCPDHVYWLGFDCLHAFDGCPGYKQDNFWPEDRKYRNFAYVKREVESLAQQLWKLNQG